MPSNLSIRILGDYDQGILPEFEFRSGEERVLRFQIYDTQNDQKVAPTAASVKTLVLSATTATDLTIAHANISQDTTDLSTFSVTLTEAQTAVLQTGWLRFQYVTGSAPNDALRIAYRAWGLKKVPT